MQELGTELFRYKGVLAVNCAQGEVHLPGRPHARSRAVLRQMSCADPTCRAVCGRTEKNVSVDLFLVVRS